MISGCKNPEVITYNWALTLEITRVLTVNLLSVINYHHHSSSSADQPQLIIIVFEVGVENEGFSQQLVSFYI